MVLNVLPTAVYYTSCSWLPLMDYHGLDTIMKQTFCLILDFHKRHKKNIALGLVGKKRA